MGARVFEEARAAGPTGGRGKSEARPYQEPPELERPVELTWWSQVVEPRSGECNARASSGSRSGEVGGDLRQGVFALRPFEER
jgi:hypothetical protein